MQPSFPHRIAAARTMQGLSLQALADRLGDSYNKQLLNRLENGSQAPSGEQIIALSTILKKPIDYFTKPLGVAIGKVDFRKTLKVGKKVTDRIIEVSKDYLERYLELEDLLGIETRPSFDLQKVRLDPNDKESIRQAAKKLRKEVWMVGQDALGSIIQILENQGIKVYVLEDLDGAIIDTKFSGFSTIVNGNIGYIVINGNKEIPLIRRRFTLLHEFAHLYLDLEGLGEKEAEKLCDAFAGAILVPDEELVATFGERRTQIHISELKLFKSQYGAGLSTIMYALFAKGIISKAYFTSWFILYNKVYREDEVLGFKGEEKSTRFMQLLLRALSTEVISESKAAALNNQKVGEFNALLDEMFG